MRGTMSLKFKTWLFMECGCMWIYSIGALRDAFSKKYTVTVIQLTTVQTIVHVYHCISCGLVRFQTVKSE